LRCSLISRPRKTISSFLPKASGPSFSLMPYWVTIARARLVAFSMSFEEPVVVSPKTSVSATFPPSMPAILSSNSVLVREAHRVAEGHAAADDRHLRDRVALGKHALHDGVSALVVRDDLLLLLRDDPAAALGARDHAVDRLVELGHADALLVTPRREDRGLVDEVRQIGAGEAGRTAGERLDVHRLVER